MNRYQKLNFILDYIEKHKITAYVISKNTNLTEVGINKILNGKSKTPREKTLDSIIQYLTSCDNETTKSDNNLIKLNDALLENIKLTRKIIKLQNLLRINKIEFKEFF